MDRDLDLPGCRGWSGKQNSLRRLGLSAVLLGAGAIGCVGTVANDAPDRGKPGRTPGQPSDPGSPGPAGPPPLAPSTPTACKADQIGLSPLRRLTREEYDNSVA